MRVAAIYDIHGNLPALEAVLLNVRQENVDRIVVGGDVFPGPMPAETLECLLDLDVPVTFIRGNGDREVLARMQGTETEWYRSAMELWRRPIQWSAEQLRTQDQALLASWPSTCQLWIDGLGDVLFCHATPRSDTEIFTRVTASESLLPVFEPHNVPIVVCGHTHMQFDRRIGQTRVVNAGSVGMPFGNPGACWILLGSEIDFRRTEYDLDEAARRVSATGYPDAEQFARRHVLCPPSEEETLAAFKRVEIRAEPGDQRV
ncbi:MAG: metallophosphoesterase family protein [Planctomycetaceae bacterium]|nr:metallophosphoesterase family protein [Planctomycetaceae bacterium]